MSHTPAITQEDLNAKKLLLPFVVGLVALCSLLQLVITLTGGEIRLAAGLMTGVVALYYAGFLLFRRHALQRVRFGPLVAHAVTYVAVVGSFQLHAAILGFSNSVQLRGDAHLPVDPGWFGPTFAMAGIWAVGFLVHAVASISQRGFER